MGQAGRNGGGLEGDWLVDALMCAAGERRRMVMYVCGPSRLRARGHSRRGRGRGRDAWGDARQRDCRGSNKMDSKKKKKNMEERQLLAPC